MSDIDDLFAARDAENAAALAKAEAEARASGKELFSLARLEELLGEGSLREREASLKLRYYVGHPEIKNLADFVAHLGEHEVWG
jgi:hypothetical protein